MESDADAMLGWNAVPGLGPKRIRRLVDAAGGALAAARDPARWWKYAGRGAPPPPTCADLARLTTEQHKAAHSFGARVWAFGAPAYPPRLMPPKVERPIEPAPVLFTVGDHRLLDFDSTTIGIIGARACTPYGREQATRFGTGFADFGVTVVSGAARGIDQAAMRGAVRAKGKVVAVLGSALDRLYPKDANLLLAEILEHGGLVVSEYAFGTSTRPGNFPRRNRLLATACDALLVVQASCRSGTMSTCNFTTELGRDIYAVPGEVDCPVSEGPLALIQDGSPMAMSPSEVLHQMRRTAPPEAHGKLDPLLAAIGKDERSVPDLAEDLGRSETAIAQQLVDLELRGLVRRLAGGLYHRSGPF